MDHYHFHSSTSIQQLCINIYSNDQWFNNPVLYALCSYIVFFASLIFRPASEAVHQNYKINILILINTYMVTLAKFVSLNLTVSFSFYQNTSFKGDKIFRQKSLFFGPKAKQKSIFTPTNHCRRGSKSVTMGGLRPLFPDDRYRPPHAYAHSHTQISTAHRSLSCHEGKIAKYSQRRRHQTL